MENPFPTLKKQGATINKNWSVLDKIIENTSTAESRFKSAINFRNSPDTEIILFGSFARYEMTEKSDFDWTLLIDGVVDNQHKMEALKIQGSLIESGLISPGTTGTFGNLIFSHDLVHQIGGGADSNANLTRRLLMILESRPLLLNNNSPIIWNNVLSNILERYFEEDIHFSPKSSRKVPRFLLNDLTRYWRTICVDYASKFREQNGKKWALRNAKLRFSRKLIYASGLAFCLSCQLTPPMVDGGLFGSSAPDDPKPFIEEAVNFASTPPLEYLARFIDKHITTEETKIEIINLIFDSYCSWLELIAKSDVREHLENLKIEDATKSEDFNKLRDLSKKFADGLKLLFFNRSHDNNPIANLSLDYVGF